MNSYQPKTVKMPIPFRGHSNSADMRDFQDSVVADLNGLSVSANANFSDLYTRVDSLTRELRLAQNRHNSLKEFMNSLNVASTDFTYINNLSESDDIFFHPTTPDARRCQVHDDYGLILPPLNAIFPMFYGLSADYDEVVMKTVTSSISTAIDTVSDWEFGGDIETGEPSNALHPDLSNVWVRRVYFSPDSDVREVRMQATFEIPQTGYLPNMLRLIPYPYKNADILKIEYSSDLSGSFRDIAEIAPFCGAADEDGDIIFTPVYNADSVLIHFPATRIARLRVTFAQRNATILSGRKVFEYGARLLSLSRAEYDTVNNEADPYSHTTNNNFLIRVTAPEGYFFSALKYFKSDPFDVSNKHLRWSVSEDADFSDQVVWTSGNTLPQDSYYYDSGSVQGIRLNMLNQNKTQIWVKGITSFASTDEAGSPFPSGTPAFVNTLTMKFRLQRMS